MSTTPIVDRLIFSTCLSCGLLPLHAQIITAQARHESGMYTSRLFELDNNIFGMKIPYKRKSPFISAQKATVKPPANEGGYYTHFEFLCSSIQDLLHRLNYSHIEWSSISSTDEYCDFLIKIGYFTDTHSHYRIALKRHFDSLTHLPQYFA